MLTPRYRFFWTTDKIINTHTIIGLVTGGDWFVSVKCLCTLPVKTEVGVTWCCVHSKRLPKCNWPHNQLAPIRQCFLACFSCSWSGLSSCPLGCRWRHRNCLSNRPLAPYLWQLLWNKETKCRNWSLNVVLIVLMEGLTIATGSPRPTVFTNSSAAALVKTYVLGQSPNKLEILTMKIAILQNCQLTYTCVISFKISSLNDSQTVISFSPVILGWYTFSLISLWGQNENADETCTSA